MSVPRMETRVEGGGGRKWERQKEKGWGEERNGKEKRGGGEEEKGDAKVGKGRRRREGHKAQQRTAVSSRWPKKNENTEASRQVPSLTQPFRLAPKEKGLPMTSWGLESGTIHRALCPGNTEV